MKKLLLNAAFVLAELVLKGLFLAVLAIPVMIALGVAGLLSVLVQAMAFARRTGVHVLARWTLSHIWFTAERSGRTANRSRNSTTRDIRVYRA
jgi:membrane protein implicated in regulation of membrane protease activity